METIITEEMKEEIMELGRAAKIHDIYVAIQVRNELSIKNFPIECLLGCIYKYGKIQGIREERAKRKKALANIKS